MGLVLFIYLAGLVSGLSVFTTLVGIGCLVGSLMCFICGSDSYGEDEQRLYAHSRKLCSWGVLCMLLSVFIPSKDTMYMMAGAYGATEIAKHESMQQVPDMLNKTMKIINQELDKKLEQ